MVDEKFWRENRKENIFRLRLVGWEGKKINGGIQVFSPGYTESFFPKIKRKLSRDGFFLN